MTIILFEGCYNFRDLGGRRTSDGRAVAAGLLYRADSVHLMTEQDASRARDELGLRLLIDLRGDMEIRMAGCGLLADGGMRRLHYPFNDRAHDAMIDSEAGSFASLDRSPKAMAQRYLTILDASSGFVVDAVRELASQDGLPAVFFCSAGKDRTGVLSAVVLGALDVVKDEIVDDYVRTADSIVKIIGRFAARTGPGSIYAANPPEHFTPHAETMHIVLDAVERDYGSFEGYLLAKGATAETLRALQDALLTPQPPHQR